MHPDTRDGRSVEPSSLVLSISLLVALTGCVGQIVAAPEAGTGTGGTGTSGAGTGGPGTGGPGFGGSGTGGPGTGGSGFGGSGNGGSGAGGSGGDAVAGDLPCDVAALLSTKCVSCHGSTLVGGAPMSLLSYADLTAPAQSDPTRTNAVVAVARMMNTIRPMPPVGVPAATPTEIASLQSWISAGYPTTGCATGIDAGTTPDPFSVPPTCTSNTTWTRRTSGSGSMEPGMACVNCHASSGGEAPTFMIAGTIYPTAHEPDLCNGANGTNGAQVVITGANGVSTTLTPNAAGNFYYTGAVATPFRAKVIYLGRERDMASAQTSGDCNSCHTQNGAMSAPGRIILP